MHETVWSVPASRDLNQLISYIARDSPQNAEVIRSRILKSVELLAQMPYAGRVGRVFGTRERVVSKTPFIRIYRICPEQIIILRCYRGARKSPEGSSL